MFVQSMCVCVCVCDDDGDSGRINALYIIHSYTEGAIGSNLTQTHTRAHIYASSKLQNVRTDTQQKAFINLNAHSAACIACKQNRFRYGENRIYCNE